MNWIKIDKNTKEPETSVLGRSKSGFFLVGYLTYTQNEWSVESEESFLEDVTHFIILAEETFPE